MIKHPFLIKTLSKLGIDFSHGAKALQKPTANIMLHGEIVKRQN